jgi:hypothetical protein
MIKPTTVLFRLTLVMMSLLILNAPYAQAGDALKDVSGTESVVQLRQDLKIQHQALRSVQETEDAFSLKLAEHYFDYGKLLIKANELKEAEQAIYNMVHIIKVNHGLNTPQQLPALRTLFLIHYEQGNTQNFESDLASILWLEKQNNLEDQTDSYDLLLQSGHYFLNSYRAKPRASPIALDKLKKAKSYFRTAIVKQKNNSLSDVLPPYAELALSSFYESQIIEEVHATLYFQNKQRTGELTNPRDWKRKWQGYPDSYPLRRESLQAGISALKSYRAKADREGNDKHSISALLAIGDFFVLAGQAKEAYPYYRDAWQLIQSLEPELKGDYDLATPQALPAFPYAQPLLIPSSEQSTRAVKMNFKVNAEGVPITIRKISRDEQDYKYYRAARNKLKKMLFRPAVEHGVVIDSQMIGQDIDVRRKKSDVATEKQPLDAGQNEIK